MKYDMYPPGGQEGGYAICDITHAVWMKARSNARCVDEASWRGECCWRVDAGCVRVDNMLGPAARSGNPTAVGPRIRMVRNSHTRNRG